MPSRKGKPNKSTWEIKELIDSSGDMAALVKGLFKLAPRNPNAAKLLLEYRFGKPSQSIDLNHAGRIDLGLDEARHIIDHLFNGHPEVSQDVPSEVGSGPFEVPGSQ